MLQALWANSEIMKSESEKPWLFIDESELQIVVGNRSGLSKLKNAIDLALETGDPVNLGEIEETNIEMLLYKEKEQYLESCLDRQATIGQKLGGIILAGWFVVLPVVAIFLLIGIASGYLSQEEKVCAGIPLHTPLKQKCNALP